MADVILVNSRFTSRVFYETFLSLKDKQIDVLYPSLNTEVFDAVLNEYSNNENEEKVDDDKNELARSNRQELEKSKGKKFIFLSINRYERKKDLKLAIEAMWALRTQISEAEWKSCHLIMAGGYDKRVTENVEHFAELQSLAESRGLGDHISFMRSISDRQKIHLLRRTFCLIYTPTNEHFGIVPIEVYKAI
jgi:glycosyltransferase involved in cell wall biosynthesis